MMIERLKWPVGVQCRRAADVHYTSVARRMMNDDRLLTVLTGIGN